MKRVLVVVLVGLSLNAGAQQWEWAVTADSVYGNQETKMICRSSTNVFALLIQNGPSVINATYLDSGCVIINVTSGGQIVWANHYAGTIQSLYATNTGALYFIGYFSGLINFGGTTLISHGGKDIMYGKLDASGNTVWVTSAGGLQDDTGNAIITDLQGNLFLAGKIKDDYYTGTQLITGNNGLGTYLLRCDLNGNYISSYTDSLPYINLGGKFNTRADGTLYLSTHYDYYPCNYVCDAYTILKINPFDYSLTNIAEFYPFEYLWSWTITNDSTIAANFNTCSHYENCYTIFTVTSITGRTLRKGLGNGYDGNVLPYITKGMADELIIGGDFNRGWNFSLDTLWYDNLFVLPDTLPNVIIGGVNTANQFTWVLHSEGTGVTLLSDMVSDEQGHTYSGGSYNNTNYWSINYDTLPQPVTFGNTVLPAQNHYSRFFIAGSNSSLTTSLQSKIQNPTSEISLTPNPSSGIFTLHSAIQNPQSAIKKICVFDLLGNCVFEKAGIKNEDEKIDLSAKAKGIYFVKVEMERSFDKLWMTETSKIIIQ